MFAAFEWLNKIQPFFLLINGLFFWLNQIYIIYIDIDKWAINI